MIVPHQVMRSALHTGCCLLMAGKGSMIYSSFNSSSKDPTSQLLWQIKYSDRSMTEVDNSPTNTSRVSNSVDSFSEFMAKQAVSAPLVLRSGKGRLTALMFCCQITCQTTVCCLQAPVTCVKHGTVNNRRLALS